VAQSASHLAASKQERWQTFSQIDTSATRSFSTAIDIDPWDLYVKQSAVSVITARTLLVAQVESLPATLQTAGLHVQGSAAVAGRWRLLVAISTAAL
jgi:hypothetical protein